MSIVGEDKIDIDRGQWNDLLFVLVAIFASVLLLSAPVSAQQEDLSQQKDGAVTGPPGEGESKTTDKDKTDQRAKPELQNGTSNDRLFYTLPNFLTLEDAGKVPPLSTAQKFKVVLRSSFDYVEYPWYGALAGISQWENSEAGYGQGAAGYGKRYAASFADGTLENFMTGAILPSLLRQDPRFYQTSKGSFLHRLGYAVSRIFVTRTDRGGEQFNYSEIFGSAIAAGISTYSYHPRADRTVPNTASVWGSEVGYDTLTIVVKEFWPDIRRKISHKRHPEAAGP